MEFIAWAGVGDGREGCSQRGSDPASRAKPPVQRVHGQNSMGEDTHNTTPLCHTTGLLEPPWEEALPPWQRH